VAAGDGELTGELFVEGSSVSSPVSPSWRERSFSRLIKLSRSIATATSFASIPRIVDMRSGS
jgi:hypothetical protein